MTMNRKLFFENGDFRRWIKAYIVCLYGSRIRCCISLCWEKRDVFVWRVLLCCWRFLHSRALDLRRRMWLFRLQWWVWW